MGRNRIQWPAKLARDANGAPRVENWEPVIHVIGELVEQERGRKIELELTVEEAKDLITGLGRVLIAMGEIPDIDQC